MKTKDLTLTIESKIPDIGNLYSKLESYSGFYTHLERTLFQFLKTVPKVNAELRKNLKAEFTSKYKIQGRIFNALWVQAKGKLDSFKEIKKREASQLKSKIKVLKSKIKKVSKEVTEGKRKHGRGFIELKSHEIKIRKQKLHWWNLKLNKLENLNTDENFTFGGFSFFLKQFTDPKYIQDHELWLQEWRRRRNNYFYFLGSKDEPNQNQHCQYFKNEELETLRITFPYCLESKLGKHLEVPVKFESYFDKKNERYYSYFKEALDQGVALSYKFLKRENGFWYTQVSFSLPKEIKDFHQGYIGIDVNYNLIATAECDPKGNWVGFKNYYLDSEELTTDQAKNELSLIVNDIVSRAKDSGKGIVREKLDFSDLKLKPKGKVTNRKLNSIQYSIFGQLLESRCLKSGVVLKSVNPAYTSTIGRNKYSKRFGVSVHTAAAFVIARRGFYRIKEKLPNQMIGVLRRGEANGFEKVLRFRHHWSAWSYLSNNLENCLKGVVKTLGDSVNTRTSLGACSGAEERIDLNYLRSRFNPEKKSFLLRYLGDLSHG